MSEDTTGDATDTDAEDGQTEEGHTEATADQKQRSDGDGQDPSAEIERLRKEAAKWRELARKHENRSKANVEAASKAKSLEDQVAELRKAMADRDIADINRAGRMAMTQVQAELAGQGFSKADVAGLLELIDPVTLLKDGEPDEAAITKLTKSLIKVGGRSTPDPDQGRRGGTPADMNSIIRRAAGVI